MMLPASKKPHGFVKKKINLKNENDLRKLYPGSLNNAIFKKTMIVVEKQIF